MTILGKVSGTKRRRRTKTEPIIILMMKIHLYPNFEFSAMASPTIPPMDGPAFAAKTNRAIGCEASSEDPNISPIVPATFDKAVEPKVPMINMKIASIGIFKGQAQPKLKMTYRIIEKT